MHTSFAAGSLHPVVVKNEELSAAYDRIEELEDLARNLAGMDLNWVMYCDPKSLRKTVFELRDEAQGLL